MGLLLAQELLAMAFGIATRGGNAGGKVPGLDKTAYAAEVWALLMLSRSVRTLPRSITILIDNQSVAIEAAARTGGSTRRFGDMPVAWTEIASNLQDRRHTTEMTWVPLHGKSPK